MRFGGHRRGDGWGEGMLQSTLSKGASKGYDQSLSTDLDPRDSGTNPMLSDTLYAILSKYSLFLSSNRHKSASSCNCQNFMESF